uniref:histidine kinase n=1 Tax=Chromera velia CCMP2878 TaxID=1169474 RepID=A0A0G4FZ54_9ALVE|eukprot:Cvel_3934.t1-p1 / transcript=Cvel_3934.t1 / gene=Cvel_3934 / organism=Chromera_velia_CCMP2878 / gene_product=Autoinducer 2 sensor kinase/phosphatase LuxQ, putative / transcript_product=Autoinducer 2 sensor kinase/phosphatase LuxQ, putative / location=Cvel_scaffold167:9598-14535(-) / protein_length=972 / sequence_SO=supercontig / SO=protein_coding / is_pseudo=false
MSLWSRSRVDWSLAVIAPGCLLLAVCSSLFVGLFCLLGFVDGYMAFLNAVYFWSLALAGLPSLGISSSTQQKEKGKEREKAGRELLWRERLSAVGFFLVDVVATLIVEEYQCPGNIKVIFRGVTVVWSKMFLLTLAFSDFHFWFLNLSSCLVWMTSCVRTNVFHSQEELLFAFVMSTNTCLMVGFLKSLISMTLGKFIEAQIMRERAELGRKQFLSYIMHEMRNPLSGGMMLIVEFRASLEGLLGLVRRAEEGKEREKKGKARGQQWAGALGGSPASLMKKRDRTGGDGSPVPPFSSSSSPSLHSSRPACPSPSLPSLGFSQEGLLLCEGVREESRRMLEYLDLLGSQFNKMKGVCDDVLQLEKLDNGGFEYVFSPRSVWRWVEQAAAQARHLFPATPPSSAPSSWTAACVVFHSEWKEGEGVREFLREVAGDRGTEGDVEGLADWQRLEQVVSNLMSNAKKFTKRGSVTLQATLRLPTEEEKTEYREIVQGRRRQTEAQKEREETEGGEGKKREKNFSSLRTFGRRIIQTSSAFLSKSSGQGKGAASGQTGETAAAEHQHQWIAAVSEMNTGREVRGGSLNSSLSDSSARTNTETIRPPPEQVHEESNEHDMGSLRLAGPLVFRVSVRDTGPGLSAEDLGKLFRPYGQVRAGELQNGGGTGLGLCICKSFIEAHGGGEIGVTSEGRGLGSEFFFQIFLPIVRNTRGCEGIQAEVEKHQGEHTQTAAAAVDVRILSPSPSVFHKEETEKNPKSKPAAAVDSKAPSQTIAAQGSLSFSSPASSSLTLEDKKKPQRELVAKDRQEASASTLFPGSSPHKSPLCGTPLRGDKNESREETGFTADVLIVDDDRFCLMCGEAAIKRLGFSVQTCESGTKAVELCVQSAHSNKFRLILMDNNMPGLEGPEAVRQIVTHFACSEGAGEGENKKKGSVVIGLTGETSDETTNQFLSAGAVRVLHKPLSAQVIQDTLRELI